MCRNHDLSKNLRARSDIDMALEHWNTSTSPRPERNLLKYKTIDADLSLRVDNYPVRVRYCEAASDATVDRYVGACHGAPKSMLEDVELAAQRRVQPGAGGAALVTTNGLKKLLSRLPEAGDCLASPVRLCR